MFVWHSRKLNLKCAVGKACFWNDMNPFRSKLVTNIQQQQRKMSELLAYFLDGCANGAPFKLHRERKNYEHFLGTAYRSILPRDLRRKENQLLLYSRMQPEEHLICSCDYSNWNGEIELRASERASERELVNADKCSCKRLHFVTHLFQTSFEMIHLTLAKNKYSPVGNCDLKIFSLSLFLKFSFF